MKTQVYSIIGPLNLYQSNFMKTLNCGNRKCDPGIAGYVSNRNSINPGLRTLFIIYCWIRNLFRQKSLLLMTLGFRTHMPHIAFTVPAFIPWDGPQRLLTSMRCIEGGGSVVEPQSSEIYQTPSTYTLLASPLLKMRFYSGFPSSWQEDGKNECLIRAEIHVPFLWQNNCMHRASHANEPVWK